MNKEPTTTPFNSPDSRMRYRILSALCSGYLDRQLASGVPPGWSRSLTARAEYVTSTRYLRRLADNWEHLLQLSGQSGTTCVAHVSVCRDRVVATAAEILDMVAALPEARLESAAGVAAASLILGDGTGPLYYRGCTTDLAEAVQDATSQIRMPTAVGSSVRQWTRPRPVWSPLRSGCRSQVLDGQVR
jgi:hypothetical protein